MPSVYHAEEQDVYGELVIMRRRIDDLERSARRWPISFEDGATTVVGDFAVTGTGSFGSGLLGVGGGPVRAIEVEKFGGSIQNTDLDTSFVDVLDIDFTPPSWAEEMFLMAVTNAQLSASATHNLITAYGLDGGGDFDGAEQTMPSGDTGHLTSATSLDETSGSLSLPTVFDLQFRAKMSSGTNSSNVFRMDGFVLWMRVA